MNVNLIILIKVAIFVPIKYQIAATVFNNQMMEIIFHFILLLRNQ